MTSSRLLLAALLLFSGASRARADLPFLIPHHVLLNSGVVFSGVLTSTDLHIEGRNEYNSGIVRVVKVFVFSGRVIPGQDVEITWVNYTGVTCPRASYDRIKGKEALWFFPDTGRRQFDANDEQHVIPMSRGALENFLEYFLKRHGPADTDLERAVVGYMRERLQTLPDRALP